MHACMLSHFSCVWLCATPWTAAHQAPQSTGFSRQEYWSVLAFPSPTDQVGDPQTGKQLYHRGSHTGVRVLSPPLGSPAWGPGIGRRSPQSIWLWRLVGLEEGVETHSSTLVWRIPWTEEPGAIVHGVTKSWTWLKWLSTHVWMHACMQGLSAAVPQDWGKQRLHSRSMHIRFCVHQDPGQSSDSLGAWARPTYGFWGVFQGTGVSYSSLWGQGHLWQGLQSISIDVSSPRSHHFGTKTWPHPTACRLQCQAKQPSGWECSLPISKQAV